MSDPILVAYASRTGSTAEVAEVIAQTMVNNGLTAEVQRMEDVKDLSPYRAVVAGSAIQGAAWLPEAMNFLQAHLVELNQKPFAAFLVCMTLAISGGKYREQVGEFMQPVRTLVKPVSEGLFAGVLNISKVPTLDNRIKFWLSVALGIWSAGDHRDWNEIRAWADELSDKLR